MSFNCEILADSLSPQGQRLTTMKITFPRFILAEFNTHRMFSRNSASSRAIPFKKMVEMVETNPFIPIAWQKDHKGMQGTEYFTGEEAETAKLSWLHARNDAVDRAQRLNLAFGVTKQLCNRLLEPFMWHTVIVSATEWENFFKLRCPQYVGKGKSVHRSKKDAIKAEYSDQNVTSLPPDNYWRDINTSQAEIHIQVIAELMWDAMNENIPRQLKAGEWHIPFGNKMDMEELHPSKFMDISNDSYVPEDYTNYSKVMIATARCARISYETLGDNPKIDYDADIQLHDRLLEMEHMSPFEHIAKAMSDEEVMLFTRGHYDQTDEEDYYGWCNNFRGFIQYRYLIE